MGGLTTHQFTSYNQYIYAKQFYDRLCSDQVTKSYVPHSLIFHKPPSFRCTYSLLDTYAPSTQSDVNIIYAVASCLCWEESDIKIKVAEKTTFVNSLFKYFKDLNINMNSGLPGVTNGEALRQVVMSAKIRFAKNTHGRLMLMNTRMYNGTPIILPPGGNVPLPCRQWDEASLLVSILAQYESALIKQYETPIDVNPMFKVTNLHKILAVYQIMERLTSLRHVINYDRAVQIINTFLENIYSKVQIKC